LSMAVFVLALEKDCAAHRSSVDFILQVLFNFYQIFVNRTLPSTWLRPREAVSRCVSRGLRSVETQSGRTSSFRTASSCYGSREGCFSRGGAGKTLQKAEKGMIVPWVYSGLRCAILFRVLTKLKFDSNPVDRQVKVIRDVAKRLQNKQVRLELVLSNF